MSSGSESLLAALRDRKGSIVKRAGDAEAGYWILLRENERDAIAEALAEALARAGAYKAQRVEAFMAGSELAENFEERAASLQEALAEASTHLHDCEELLTLKTRRLIFEAVAALTDDGSARV